MDILRMIIIGFAVISFAILIIASVKGLRINKKTLWMLFAPLIIFFATMAYSFDYIGNANNDLFRYTLDADRMKTQGFFSDLRYCEPYALFFRVILWIAKELPNYHWFAFAMVLIEFLIFAYITINCSEKYHFTSLEVLLAFIFRMCLCPAIMSYAAFRGTLAASLFSLFLYYHYDESHGKIKWVILGISVLTHTTIVVPFAIFVVSHLFKKINIMSLVFCALPLLLYPVQLVLSSINNIFCQFYSEKLRVYMSHPTQWDITKSRMMIAWYIMLVIVQFVVVFKVKKNVNKCASFIIAYMMFTFGMFFMISEFYLRLLYVLAVIMPIILGNNKTLLKNQGVIKLKKPVYFLCAVAFVAVIITRGAWCEQMIWL